MYIKHTHTHTHTQIERAIDILFSKTNYMYMHTSVFVKVFFLLLMKFRKGRK